MWCFWAPKGGTGCSVVAAAMARVVARAGPTVLVDLAGDQHRLFGAEAVAAGLADWLTAPAPPPDALARLMVDVAPGLQLLPWHGPGAETGPEAEADLDAHERVDGDRFDLLLAVLAAERRPVLLDLGVVPAGRGSDRHVRALESSARSTMVLRPCTLSVAEAGRHRSPDDVIIVGERRAGLTALGARVGAVVRRDRRVARAVDRGRFGGRLPRSLDKLAKVTR